MAEQVKLFGIWASPFSKRIELALKLKGIKYEYIEEDLQNKSPELLKYNPVNKQIPVFVHNGNPIAESLVILQYIDETWKNYPLLPEDPYQKAMACFWAKVIDDKILPAAKQVNAKEGEEREKAIGEIHYSMKMLEKELEGKKFFGGDSIGYLDIVAIIIALWLVRIQEFVGFEMVSEDKFPLLSKWIGKLTEVPAVNDCVPPKEEYLAFMKVRFEQLKAQANQ